MINIIQIALHLLKAKNTHRKVWLIRLTLGIILLHRHHLFLLLLIDNIYIYVLLSNIYTGRIRNFYMRNCCYVAHNG